MHDLPERILHTVLRSYGMTGLQRVISLAYCLFLVAWITSIARSHDDFGGHTHLWRIHLAIAGASTAMYGVLLAVFCRSSTPPALPNKSRAMDRFLDSGRSAALTVGWIVISLSIAAIVLLLLGYIVEAFQTPWE